MLVPGCDEAIERSVDVESRVAFELLATEFDPAASRLHVWGVVVRV